MIEKKARWKVMVCPAENGWCNFHIRRTDVRKERKGEVRRIALAWSPEQGRFATGDQLNALLALTTEERADIAGQMREILRLGLPALPGESWPDGGFA